MEKRIIEINGVKLEVDLSTATVVDQYKVGDNVKVLLKTYGDTFKSFPGVIVGFEPFQNRPTIVIGYVESDYNSAKVKYLYLNADTKDTEICPMLESEKTLDKGRVMDLFDRQILKAEQDLLDLRNHKKYFEEQFATLYKDSSET